MQVDELVCSPYRSDSSDLSMKSKLTIIAALASIACTGIPAQALSEAEKGNRAEAIGFLAAMQCFLNSGKAPKEAVEQVTRNFINKNPKLEPAFAWARTSTRGKSAVQAATPYMNAECRGFKAGSRKEMEDAVRPFLY